MYYCKECMEYFTEPGAYNPESNPHLSVEDYDLWSDHENEECCPYCGSFDIVRLREESE